MTKRDMRIKVLRRVYGIWFLRHTVPLLALEIVILILALGFFADLVFVEKVVTNALTISFKNPFRIIGYLLSAFLQTKLVTQIVIVILGTAGILLLREVNKSILSYAAMKRTQLFTGAPPAGGKQRV